MEIIIHRGATQIGGSVTEYRHNGWRLFVDFGEQLPGTPVYVQLDMEGLTKGDLSKSAMLITHYHGDHIGNIHQIPMEIPVFMGKLGIEIQKITSNHLKEVDRKQACLLERLNKAIPFEAGTAFEFGPFEIMPIVLDHSAFDACAFKIKADDTSVFHTGDFRTHGFRSGKFLKAIDKYIGKVDYVICEGTNVKRSDAALQSEHDLQKQLEEEFSQHKFNIVYLSSTNIDRLFSLYHAALRIGIPFIVDSHQKRIMDAVVNSDHIWAESSLYKYGKYKPMVLKYDKDNPGEHLIREKFIAFLKQKGYVLIARSNPRFDHLINKMPGESKQCYLSMWNGYVSNPASPSYNKELAAALGKGYLYRHTSGHCDMKNLRNLFAQLSPKAIIPIHTDAPEAFAKLFNNQWPVRLLQDGDSFMLHSKKLF